MNNRQKLVQQQFLQNEQTVLSRLEFMYDKSLGDINEKIKNLEFTIGDLQEEYDWMDDDDPQKAIVKSKIQSKIYQKQYQEQLQSQVGGILSEMQRSQFVTVSDYLDKCYEDGFIGSIFDLHGQGVPLTMPINQESMVKAVQLDSKISKGLYTKLGEDVDVLKKRITSEITRSISTGSTYAQTAQRLAAQTKIGYNKAARIARTEGHRIQNSAADDVAHLARDRGADVVKQWDSTLDGKTRESHVAVDGQIRELDEAFSNGLMFPGDPRGSAAEVVNCRCAYLQRVRRALDDEDKVIRMDNETGELIECKNYTEFKEKYLSSVERQSKVNYSNVVSKADKEQFERYKKNLGKNSPQTLEEFYNLKYNKKDEWETLKHQYRTVNRYEVDGKVSVDEILELDNAAFYTKKKGFDFSNYTGKTKKNLKNDLANGGNAAAMHFDGKTYFSHSKFGSVDSLEYSLYVGEYPAVPLSKNRIFDVLDLGDNIPRQYDTEAKMLEFVATQKKPTDKFTVTILSEKHICESCQGVVEQFKTMFPDATVNIVSGKRGYNGSEEGLHTWKRRKKVK